jgi:hypothetical protein
MVTPRLLPRERPTATQQTVSRQRMILSENRVGIMF